MDRFDKLISKKVSQMEQPNADAAWNDFVQFRESKLVTSQKPAWYFSKTALSVMAVLLLSIGAIGGYQLAQMNSGQVVANANLTMGVNVPANESSVHKVAPNRSADQTDVPAEKQEMGTGNSQNVSVKPSVRIPMENVVLKTAAPMKASIHGETVLMKDVDVQVVSATQPETDRSEWLLDTTIAASMMVPDMAVETMMPVEAGGVENQKGVNFAMSVNDKVETGKEDGRMSVKESAEAAINETINDNPPGVAPSASTPNLSNYALAASSEGGLYRKGKRMNMNSYLSVFNRYTDMSFYSLENSNDMTAALNANFTINPANTGVDNRYSLLLGTRCDFIQTPVQTFDMQSRDSYIGNSFTMLNNKVGVGLAVQNISMDKLSALNIYMSSAYKIILAKNSQLRLGFGFSSSSVSIVNPDAPKSDVSAFSFHVGARYMYKTIYAQASLNNFAPIMVRNSASNYAVPTTLQMSFGGRLYLSKTWAFHPQLSLSANSDHVNVGFLSSFSYQNKWLVGVQTNDFKSVGLHAGVYAKRRMAIILKTNLGHSFLSSNSLMETGELMLKFELGRYKR